MGLLDKLFPKREKDFLTDDERAVTYPNISVPVGIITVRPLSE